MRRPLRIFRFNIFLWALALSSAASAQTTPTGEFSTSLFRPAPGSGNYLAVDGARVGPHLTPTVGLTIDYAQDPFTLFDCSQTTSSEDCKVSGVKKRLVRYTLTGNIHAALSLWERLQLGLVLPLVLTNGEQFSVTPPGSDRPVILPGGTAFAVGDIIVSAKATIIGTAPRGLGLAVVGFGTVPLGQITAEDSYVGDSGATFGGHLVAEYLHGGFHAAVNIGGFYRKSEQLFSTRVASRLTYRFAAGYDATSYLFIFGEVDGASGLNGEVDANPLEARLAGRIRVGDFAFTLAGGGGIVSGVGTPTFRVIGGFAWSPDRTDSDHDGIKDAEDSCPADPEDKDQFEDQDGCPEADNDDDGILDPQDRCPLIPEDKDGVQDTDGCVDRDDDHDGVEDSFDSCPREPEDKDGDRDGDGCPDDDRDRDGVRDANDACPDQPEDTDGFGDEDGCPEVDFDGDTIPDDGDECPDKAEIINGVLDEDGCPEEDADNDGLPDTIDGCPQQPETLNGVADSDGCPDGDALVQIEGDRIILLHQIQFAKAKATVRGRQSRQIIQAVATILRQNPSYRKIRIEGHTDDQGVREKNLKLSQDRADAVMAALVKLGISSDRLSAIGYGPDRPLQANDTPQGRAANRRVEFHIERTPAASGTPAPDARPAE